MRPRFRSLLHELPESGPKNMTYMVNDRPNHYRSRNENHGVKGAPFDFDRTLDGRHLRPSVPSVDVTSDTK